MARFVEVTRDPETPSMILQRLASGESLKDIARAWGIPKTLFLTWVASQSEFSEQCKRVLQFAGIELRLEGLEIVDAVEGAETSEAIAAAKLRAEYREKLSRDLNRPLFGKQVQHQHTHTHDLGERLRRARERVVVEQAPETATIGTDAPSALPPVEVLPVPEPELI